MAQILFIILIISSFVAGCGLKEEEYVAIINDEKISLEEYNVYLWRIKQVYQSIGEEDIWETKFDGEPAEEVAKESTLDLIKSIKVQVQEAEKNNISLTEEEKEEAESQAESLKIQMGDEIESMGISDEVIKIIAEENIISQKLYEELTKDYVENQEEFEEFFEENKDFLKQVRVKHILLKTHDIQNGELVPLSEEEQKIAKEKAEEALERARAGEDFASLVHEYSEDEASIPNDGEYVFGRNQGMEPNFEEAAFSLKVGEISDLVETSYGYHIIKLEEEIEPDKEEVRANYIELKKQSFYQSKVQEWIDTAKVEINEDVWEKIKVK